MQIQYCIVYNSFCQILVKKQTNINILIVDEAHTLYLWGLDGKTEAAFRSEFRKIAEVTALLKVRVLVTCHEFEFEFEFPLNQSSRIICYIY